MPHTCKHIYFQVETGRERGDCAGCDSETETSRVAVGDAYPDIGYTYVGVIETQRLSGGVSFLKRKVGEKVGGGCWGPVQQPGPWRGVGGGSGFSWGWQAAGLDKDTCQRKAGKESLGGCPSPRTMGT